MTYITVQTSLFIQNKETDLRWHSPSPMRPSHALIFFCETTKIATICLTTIDRRTLEANKDEGLETPREFDFEGQQD